MHTSLPVAVVTIILKDNKILLLKRKNTPWMNWFRWLPWGRLEQWESMTSWAIRELNEELWIIISEENILFKSIIQHKDERWERLYFVLYIEDFFWIPSNMEKDKCDEIKWFNLDNLVENITPQVGICLNTIKNKISYSEYWY